LRVSLGMMMQRHGHKGMAVGSYSPAPRTRNLGDQAADMQSPKQPPDSGAQLALYLLIGQGMRVQRIAQLSISQTLQVRLAIHDRPKYGDVLLGGGIEPTIATLLVFETPGAIVQQLLGGGGISHDSQGCQVRMIRCPGDLRVPIQAAHTFAHREPTQLPLALADALTADAKPIRVINDGLDAQHQSEFVIHLDPVLADPMLDPHAFDAGFEVGQNLLTEAGRELLAEEAQQIASMETQQRMLNEFAVQGSQCRSIAKDNIGGKLGLIDRPVVTVRGQGRLQQRVDEAGQFVEQGGPILLPELIGHPLRAGCIGKLDEDIVELGEAQPMTFHFASQPFMTVNGNLNGEGQPALQPHVNQAEFGMEKVVVEANALARSTDQPRPSAAPGQLEAATAFQLSKHANQALSDLRFGRDAGGFFIFADVSLQKAVGTAMFGRRRFGVNDQAVGLSLGKMAELLERQILIGQEVIQPFGIADRTQMTFEDDPIKAIENGGDFVGVLGYESMQGVLRES